MMQMEMEKHKIIENGFVEKCVRNFKTFEWLYIYLWK